MNFIETLREIESINNSFFELNNQIDVYRKRMWDGAITSDRFDELIKPFEVQKKELFIRQKLLINNAHYLLFDENISTFISVWNFYAKRHRRLGEKTEEKIKKEFEEKSGGCSFSIKGKFTFSLCSPMTLLNYPVARVRCYLHGFEGFTDKNNYILELSIYNIYRPKYKYIEDIPGAIKQLHDHADTIKEKTKELDKLKSDLGNLYSSAGIPYYLNFKL